MKEMEILSYGGGVQTAALLILNHRGEIDNPAEYAVFADTGSELKTTYQHISIMRNWLERFSDIPLVIVKSKKGKLHEWKHEMMLPMYFEEGGFNRRQCTNHWKIIPIRKWLRKQGVKKATIQIGISTDEFHRAKSANVQWITHRWPLIELKLTRQDCINIIRRERFIPVPPKSSCFMCPYRRISEWKKLRAELPREFARAVEFEKKHPGLYLNYKTRPLDQIVGMQTTMFKSDECGGYCWT